MTNRLCDQFKRYIQNKSTEELLKEAKKPYKTESRLLDNIIKTIMKNLKDEPTINEEMLSQQNINTIQWLAYRRNKLNLIAKYLNSKNCNENNFREFRKNLDEPEIKDQKLLIKINAKNRIDEMEKFSDDEETEKEKPN